jgi:SPP1 family predicted phage head-tail adaptor
MMNALLNLGDLKHRLLLEQPVESADGAGGVTRSYATVATVWAALTPSAARSEVAADALGAEVTHEIVIRFRADVTTRHRLRDGSRIFRILALRDQDGNGRFLSIQAQERVD